ncbi:SMP-30/gluconolactonase/LRE family protein [Methyloligella solikamskensis]|uniref:SMP-30/gluconolactonase/LRE family protein n=1 Tax=Methyloligella solikamskensis TaxID=1177756 RepID=A0ABW3JCB3_9HYPH
MSKPINAEQGGEIPERPSRWRVACETRAVLGESPLYDPRDGKIWWVDIKGCRLWAYEPGTGSSAGWELQTRVACIVVPDTTWPEDRQGAGSFLCACDSGFAWLTVAGDAVSLDVITDPEPGLPGNRFNDGKLGPDGRFFAGTMDDAEEEATGTLYALSPDGSIAVIDRDYMVPNGPAFSPDGRAMFVNDSAKGRTYRFALGANGEIGERSLFRQFGDGEAAPDGMTTDAHGNLLVGLWGGWGIAILSPEGALQGKIPLPTAQITSCAFNGENGSRLYATSAAIGLEPEDRYAGNLFAIDLL